MRAFFAWRCWLAAAPAAAEEFAGANASILRAPAQQRQPLQNRRTGPERQLI